MKRHIVASITVQTSNLSVSSDIMFAHRVSNIPANLDLKILHSIQLLDVKSLFWSSKIVQYT